jgi:hypothetical protein
VGGPRSTGFINTVDTLGSAFLSHQFTVRQTMGVQYQFLDIIFPGRDTRTRTNGVLLFDQIAINPHTSLSIFAGPEYSRIHDQLLINILGIVLRFPVSQTLWSAAGGAMLDWRRNRLGLQATFVQRVSDGGGALGAVEMRDASVRIREKLARRWVASLDAEGTQRNLLGSSAGKLEVFKLGTEISHELAHHMWVRASYQRQQPIRGSVKTLQFAEHNRVTLSLERDFTVPLGR